MKLFEFYKCQIIVLIDFIYNYHVFIILPVWKIINHFAI